MVEAPGVIAIPMSAQPRRRHVLARGALQAPAILLVMVLVVAPLFVMLIESFRNGGHWSVKNYVAFFFTPAPLIVLRHTLQISALVTVIALAVSVPACAFVAHRSKRVIRLFLGVVALSFTVSILVRTFAWQVILIEAGPLNSLLHQFGLHSLHLLYTRTAVVLAMVQIMIPYATLIVMAGMQRLDRDQILAAQASGAGRLATFRATYWPQIKPSIILAGLFVFTISCGFYVTPALLGGTGEIMLGQWISAELQNDYVSGSGAAAASGMVLGAILTVLVALVILMTRTPYRRLADDISIARQ
jgi:putative spermidine/putrescine transport system permease protein